MSISHKFEISDKYAGASRKCSGNCLETYGKCPQNVQDVQKCQTRFRDTSGQAPQGSQQRKSTREGFWIWEGLSDIWRACCKSKIQGKAKKG